MSRDDQPASPSRTDTDTRNSEHKPGRCECRAAIDIHGRCACHYRCPNCTTAHR